MNAVPYTFRVTKTLLTSEKERAIYSIICVWKIVEGLVPNHSDLITCSFSDRRGRTCVLYHAGAGQ